MSTVVVRHYLYGPGQTGVPRRRCTVTLTGLGLWLSNENGEIIDSVVEESDDTGLVEVTVTPNSEIVGPDSYYVFRIAGTDVARAFIAPVSGAAVKLVDCLVDETTLDPLDPDLPSLYLARAELGVANGVASLGANGKVPSAQLPAGQGGVTDHGDLTGLGDDDHTQYYNQTRGDARYSQLGHSHTSANITDFASAVNTIVNAAVAALVASAPAALDTLDELAAALGDDANFATTVTNSLAGKVAASLLDAKGDLFIASAADTPARLAVGATGEVLSADSSQSTGARWVTQDRAADPLDIMYGLVAANDNPARFRDPSPLGTNGWWTAIFVPAGKALTTCWCMVHSAGTLGAGGENGFAVYDITGAQLGTTPSDSSLFTSTGVRGKALSAPVAASTSRRVVFMELRREGWSVEPSFAFQTGPSGAGAYDGGWPSGIRKSFYAGGTGHPASINPATHGSPTGGYQPWMGIS
ncbi:hypothetical protein Lesp02_83910 [Lentzea sp. NBRC 105346]|uniref:hypothetical protein n=1 Tax=Lentzea sp. NBRC 105346 TaxID=3032205 RepID=UPI0024A452FB|nr:hypothetical protein [Lentzea sp. NBRC 105346]GLZ36204.1 hypothetical protein Lesp02_83910 [Lentzea sp. NBRC 105346]